MKYLIGITGKKRAGKDTVAQMLAEIVSPMTSQQVGFADEVYNDLAEMLKLSVSYIKENKQKFRLMLQGYGTDYCRETFGSDYWIRRWIAVTYKSRADVIIVPDVRFLNEAVFINKNGGTVWRVERPSTETDSHISENELNDYAFPTLKNDSTLENLKEQVKKAYGIYSYQHPV